MRTLPLAGKEEEGNRPQDCPVEDMVGRAQERTVAGHRFEKHSDLRRRRQHAILDFSSIGGHTQATMRSKARALELPTPLPVQLLAFGLVILSILVILPH